jgi:DNA helicase-2/ATP-dependent DNA helicase PcrA
MKAQEHPHYIEEAEHLTETVEFIETELRRLRDYNPWESTPFKYEGNALFNYKKKNLEQLKNLQYDSPYFGRVDWLPADGDENDTFYVGKFEVRDMNVFSWADNLAADLYNEGRTKRERGKLLLKRTFDIDGRELVSISDEFVDPDFDGGLVAERFSDSLLVQLLRENRRGALHDIVATIQAEQYELIREPKDQLLVIQGVAGSGKTTVALHRIAYLLYHHRNDERPLSPHRILVLGPNAMFMRYIANVLPSLGEHDIPQRTFDAWLIEHLDSPTEVKYEPQDASLELLLDPQVPLSEKVMRYRNAQHKGSLKMAELLERYVGILHREILNRREALSVTLYSSSTGMLRGERSVDELREMLNGMTNLPFNQRREAMEERLVRLFTQELLAQAHGSRRDWIERHVQEQVHDYFEDWHALNVSVAYRRLLRTPRLLKEAGEDLFEPRDLELLAQDAPTALTPFRFSDLAALLYLKILLDGVEGPAYHHIVIDEAQDITPLHFLVLRRYSQDGSMTVLGDLSQGIYPYHGIHRWEDLDTAAGGQKLALRTLRTSYRSTKSIIDFANGILERIGASECMADPVPREGATPQLHACENRDARFRKLQEILQAEHRAGYSSIAVVCKTLAACRELHHELGHELGEEYRLIEGREDNHGDGVAIIPAYLTKGLEFDVVIVVDADAETYVANDLDVRLLYVALTRASHVLHICWSGALTPLLDVHNSHLEVNPPFAGHLDVHPVTVADYATSRGDLDPDWCIIRLAGADKLDLLNDGTVDQTVLDVLVRGFLRETESARLESTIPPLPSHLRQGVFERAVELEDDPNVRTEALALLQVTYGLARNALRLAGIEVLEEGGDDLGEEVVQLVAALKAIRERGVVLSAGSRTTRRRLLDAVHETRHPRAEKLLDALINYGLVEEGSSGQFPWIRVVPKWLHGLIALSLGYEVEAWDEDLLDQLITLPESLEWTILEEEDRYE